MQSTQALAEVSGPRQPDDKAVVSASDGSGFVIVNDCDCPDERHIAQRLADGRCFYIHPDLCRRKEFWGMRPRRPTPLEDFGIHVEVVSGVLSGKMTGGSVAVYHDGEPRRWQGRKEFQFRVQNTKISG